MIIKVKVIIVIAFHNFKKKNETMGIGEDP